MKRYIRSSENTSQVENYMIDQLKQFRCYDFIKNLNVSVTNQGYGAYKIDTKIVFDSSCPSLWDIHKVETVSTIDVNSPEFQAYLDDLLDSVRNIDSHSQRWMEFAEVTKQLKADGIIRHVGGTWIKSQLTKNFKDLIADNRLQILVYYKDTREGVMELHILMDATDSAYDSIYSYVDQLCDDVAAYGIGNHGNSYTPDGKVHIQYEFCDPRIDLKEFSSGDGLSLYVSGFVFIDRRSKQIIDSHDFFDIERVNI